MASIVLQSVEIMYNLLIRIRAQKGAIYLLYPIYWRANGFAITRYGMSAAQRCFWHPNLSDKIYYSVLANS